MVERNVLFVLALFSSVVLFSQSQLKVDSVSSLKFGSTFQCNDIWGYVDTTGVEYAIVGRLRGISVVSLADSLNPVEVYRDTAAQSIWRDIKTWKKHAYVTNETSGGLEIYDLSKLPQKVEKVGSFTGTQYPFQSSHNIYIDENGVAYIFGSADQSLDSGTVFLDVNTNPKQPIELGNFNLNYLHDGYVRGDTLYGSAVFDGVLQIIDVSDKQNPVLLGSRATPLNFTHNAWLSDDGKYIFTTDEVSGAFIAAYDVQDPRSIRFLDRITSRNTRKVIPHNTHYFNGFLVTSYYTSGISIIDAHRPDILVETGYFDTSPNFFGDGFNGCWGVYPYLPSGLIIASDMEEGLFVLRADYEKAAYLEGRIVDCEGNPIDAASLTLVGTTDTIESNLIGQFKYGTKLKGSFDLKVNANGYYSKVFSNVVLEEGITTFKEFVLLDSNSGFNISSKNSMDISIADVQLSLRSSDTLLFASTDSAGNILFENLPFDQYILNAGRWGNEIIFGDTIEFSCLNDSLKFSLLEKYEDNFVLALGWTMSGLNQSGNWTREIPIGVVDQLTVSNPGTDSDKDLGSLAFVTGNGFGAADDFDVDGETSLTSPPINFQDYVEPNLVFDYWFYKGDVDPSDYLLVQAIDSNNVEYTIDTLGLDSANLSVWIQKGYDLSVFSNYTAFEKIRFVARDQNAPTIVEAGIDNFFIQEGEFIGLDKTASKTPYLTKVLPNPFSNEIQIDLENASGGEMRLFNAEMRLIREEVLLSAVSQLNGLEKLPPGLYFLELSFNSKTELHKLIKK